MMANLSKLFAQVELSDDLTVAADIFFLEIAEKAATMANHLEQTAA